MSNENDTSATFTLADDSLASLALLCAKMNATPSQVVAQIIREEARKYGIAVEHAKSA